LAIFFQLDFPVYFVTRGSKLIIDLIFTFLCDFYKILNNVFDQYSLFREFTFLAIFFGSLLGRSDFKIFCKNAASAATFKFWGVTVLGHIFFGRLWGEFTVSDLIKCLARFVEILHVNFLQNVLYIVPGVCTSILNIHCLNLIIKHKIPDCWNDFKIFILENR